MKNDGNNADLEPSSTLDLQSFRESGDQAGLPLDKLGQAFAAMFASGDDPYSSPADADGDPILAEANDAVAGGDEGALKSAADAACEISPRTILEALLFVGSPDNRPLAAQQVAGLMRGVRPAEIDELVRDLNETYRKNGCPYSIVAEGVGYRLAIRTEFAAIGERLHNRARTARLSPAAIEVLAAVAYNEPLTGEQVAKMRGVASSSILAQLVRRQLLRLERAEDRSQPVRYFTTPRFLKVFGLSSLEDLPQSEDVNR